MQRYRSAVYNFKHGRTKTRPPSQRDFVKSIPFSDGPTKWTVISGAEKEMMLTVLGDLNRDSLFITQLLESDEPFYSMTPKTWQRDLICLQSTVQRVTILLSDLSSRV